MMNSYTQEPCRTQTYFQFVSDIHELSTKTQLTKERIVAERAAVATNRTEHSATLDVNSDL